MADEVRIDPSDGVAYTFDEISQFYAGKYKKAAILSYWDTECTPVKKSTIEKTSKANKTKVVKSIAKEIVASLEEQNGSRNCTVKAGIEEVSGLPAPSRPPVLKRTKSWLVKVDGVTLLPCEEQLESLVQEFHSCMKAGDDAGAEAAQVKLLRQHPFVIQQAKPIPKEALPDGITCMSHNFKMDVRRFQQWLRKPEGKPFEEKGKGYDDGCYLTSSVLRTFLPRGFTTFVFQDSEGNTETAVLRGFKKFTGVTAADEDEVSNATSETDAFMFHGFKREDATRFAVTTKSNGENGKYAARKIFGEWYCFAGSKNTGVAWHLGKDVEKIYPIPRDAVASVGPKIISHVSSMVNNMPAGRQSEFLTAADAGRFTVMVEFNDSQHEHIFPILETRAEHVAVLNGQGYPLPQKDARAFFDQFGLFRVTCDVYDDMGELPSVMEQIRSCESNEGAVIYLERSNDTPVGLVKVKTDYYVIARRTREILRGALVAAASKGADVDDALGEVRKRLAKGMKELQHVEGCAEHHQEWSATAIAFAESWAEAFKAGDRTMRKALAHEYDGKYGSLYQRFRQTKTVLPLSAESMEAAAGADQEKKDSDGQISGDTRTGGKGRKRR